MKNKLKRSEEALRHLVGSGLRDNPYVKNSREILNDYLKKAFGELKTEVVVTALLAVIAGITIFVFIR